MFRWLWRIFCAILEKKVAKFCAGRSAQTNDQFLIGCGLPPDSETARIAIAVRRAVANVGTVDPLYIRPDDVYPDQLAVLPLWCSMDWIVYIMELEDQLDASFSNEELERVFKTTKTTKTTRVSVKEMVESVQRVLASRASAERKDC